MAEETAQPGVPVLLRHGRKLILAETHLSANAQNDFRRLERRFRLISYYRIER
jgi:hypothetical protein